MVLFIRLYKVLPVPALESVNEILKWNHSTGSYWNVLCCFALPYFCSLLQNLAFFLNFVLSKSTDRILKNSRKNIVPRSNWYFTYLWISWLVYENWIAVFILAITVCETNWIQSKSRPPNGWMTKFFTKTMTRCPWLLRSLWVFRYLWCKMSEELRSPWIGNPF